MTDHERESIIQRIAKLNIVEVLALATLIGIEIAFRC